jgi:hypothetical protein
LVDFRVSHKERPLLSHLCKDAAQGPHVNSESILLLSKEDFRSSVPESDNLVGVGLDGESEGSGKSEISQLDASSV